MFLLFKCPHLLSVFSTISKLTAVELIARLFHIRKTSTQRKSNIIHKPKTKINPPASLTDAIQEHILGATIWGASFFSAYCMLCFDVVRLGILPKWQDALHQNCGCSAATEEHFLPCIDLCCLWIINHPLLHLQRCVRRDASKRAHTHTHTHTHTQHTHTWEKNSIKQHCQILMLGSENFSQINVSI